MFSIGTIVHISRKFCKEILLIFSTWYHWPNIWGLFTGATGSHSQCWLPSDDFSDVASVSTVSFVPKSNTESLLVHFTLFTAPANTLALVLLLTGLVNESIFTSFFDTFKSDLIILILILYMAITFKCRYVICLEHNIIFC